MLIMMTLYNQAVDFILGKEERLDVVVSNAGFGIAESVEDTSIDEAKSSFETIFGYVTCLQSSTNRVSY